MQLWPTVKKMAKVVRFDISLLERLYSQPDIPGEMVKTMQHRSPKKPNAFPSKEFYDGRLKTRDVNSTESLNAFKASSFPWPIRDGVMILAVLLSALQKRIWATGRRATKAKSTLYVMC